MKWSLFSDHNNYDATLLQTEHLLTGFHTHTPSDDCILIIYRYIYKGGGEGRENQIPRMGQTNS